LHIIIDDKKQLKKDCKKLEVLEITRENLLNSGRNQPSSTDDTQCGTQGFLKGPSEQPTDHPAAGKVRKRKRDASALGGTKTAQGPAKKPKLIDLSRRK